MPTRINEGVPQYKLLTAEEAAVHLRVSRMTVWRWCKQGLIPAFRVGRRWRIHQDDLLQLGRYEKSDGT